MTASGPGSGDTPGEPDGTPAVPEYVWRLFLEDDERAIRASAPREPSARDRVPGRGPQEPPADRPDRARGTVGEAWRREETWAGPAWRELDGRARLRRVGRLAGTAAALALALTAWSQLSTGPATPGGGPAETIGQRLEESPALPTPASPAPASLAPTESGAASPAVFEPVPSAIPRASTSPWTIN
ncbi:hypothetical protein [Streptomyces violaceorubidus]|uniref:hypothetical protein n=1 Tax=Streptomyces violaceorubidus TaxID=284042 RepID=UPI0004BEF4AC|nr:hypothetical protein [Streptomyces violaceorubidus]